MPGITYDDVAFSAIRLLKSGVTTTMHNHNLTGPQACESEFEEALKAYSDAGMRVQFDPAMRSENPFVYGDNQAFLATLPDKLKRILATPTPTLTSLKEENFVKAVCDLHARYDSPMSRIGFGPLAPQWCTKELLLEVRRAADRLGAPIHVHALQTIFQKIYGLKFLDKTLISYMNDIGFLGPRLVIGHCVWPTESDIELLAETGTAVTHHPSCNLRVRNGISPVFHMLQSGVRVGLGLDGKSINDDDDMIQEMKVCFLLHRISSLEPDSPHLTARQVFQMATENGASLLGFGQELGRLEPGRLADLVLLDFEKMSLPYVDPAHDPIDILLYRGLGRHVHTVMVNGRIVLQEGSVLTLDEEAVSARLAQAASRPRSEKETAFLNGIQELRKQVAAYYKDWINEVDIEPYWSINSRVNGLS
jgi:cytosine/adenosine deaminase-related metal-dependent hydrolase